MLGRLEMDKVFLVSIPVAHCSPLCSLVLEKNRVMVYHPQKNLLSFMAYSIGTYKGSDELHMFDRTSGHCLQSSHGCWANCKCLSISYYCQFCHFAPFWNRSYCMMSSYHLFQLCSSKYQNGQSSISPCAFWISIVLEAWETFSVQCRTYFLDVILVSGWTSSWLHGQLSTDEI